jgi:hypothetical protein
VTSKALADASLGKVLWGLNARGIVERIAVSSKYVSQSESG